MELIKARNMSISNEEPVKFCCTQ